MTEVNYPSYAEAVARALCGEPNARHSKNGELRFGTNGSLKVMIAGPNIGTCSDFETNEAGGVIDLIMLKRGCDRREAHEWLAQTFGLERPKEGKVAGKRVAAVYPYHDEAGERHFEVVRLEPKDFRQRRSENDWGVKGCRALPYRLPELIEALSTDRPIFIVEGEKDVDKLARIGVTATCNAGGAGK